MRSVTLAASAALILSGALAAQEHPNSVAIASVSVGAAANPDMTLLDRSEDLLGSIRVAADEKNVSSLRSAAEAYVLNASKLRDEIAGLPRSEGAEPASLLATGKTVASQATILDSLARSMPRRLRKDVERALAAADGLLGTLVRGRSSPDLRTEPAPHAGHARSTAGSNSGHVH